MNVKASAGKVSTNKIKLGRTADKAYLSLENTYILMNRIVVKNVYIKGIAGGGSEEKEEPFVRNWRRADSCYARGESEAELCKTDLVKSEIGYPAEMSSKQSLSAWILAVHCKMWEEKLDLDKNYYARWKQKLMIWEIFSLSRLQKILQLGESLSGNLL